MKIESKENNLQSDIGTGNIEESMKEKLLKMKTKNKTKNNNNKNSKNFR